MNLKTNYRMGMMTKKETKRRWIGAQKLDELSPFGSDQHSVRKAIEHLGYVQIDTIHVIERSHHPILFNRIPNYRVKDLHIAQSLDKSVFEYWTRLAMLFDYEHRFEAYLPKEKRVFGYFALPVMIGDEIVATLDLKNDRVRKKILIQQWNWLKKHKSAEKKKKIEEALHSFERFQFNFESTGE